MKNNFVKWLAISQSITILILLYFIFGFAFTYVLITILLIASNLFTAYIAINQTRHLRAAESGLQFVFDAVNNKAAEMDALIKKLVWAEDSPEIREISNMLKESRDLLLKSPLLFEGTVVEEVYRPSKEEIEDEKEIQEAIISDEERKVYKKMQDQLESFRRNYND